MRKRLWQLHSWLGLLAGLGLLVIGLTGSVLMFHDELETLVNPELVRVEPAPAGRLPADTLLAEVHRQIPGHEVAGWLFRDVDEAHLADLLYVRRHGSPEWLVATLDPYTGKIFASPRAGTETLTGWILELHYAFFGGHAGMLIVGLFGVLLLLLGLTGLWLYRDFWKHVFTLRWDRGARLLFSDLHKFIGITTVAFNLILGFTGAYWNITHVIGEWIQGHDDDAPAPSKRLYAEPLPLDTLIADSAARVPGFRAGYLSLPWQEDAPITFYGSVPGHFLQGPFGSTVSYDGRTHAFTAATDIREAGFWARVVDTFTPLHYGTFGGLPVKILWSLGGLSPGALALTGFLLWRLRRRATKKNRGAIRPDPTRSPSAELARTS